MRHVSPQPQQTAGVTADLGDVRRDGKIKWRITRALYAHNGASRCSGDDGELDVRTPVSGPPMCPGVWRGVLAHHREMGVEAGLNRSPREVTAGEPGAALRPSHELVHGGLSRGGHRDVVVSQSRRLHRGGVAHDAWLRALRASSDIDWSYLRSVLVTALRRIVHDAPAVEASRLGNNNVSVTAARETAMAQLMAGSEGRAWLTRGDLARASVPTRFDAHLAVMGQDAAPHAGTHRWTRYWGTDIELTVIAAAMRCAVVCVECASSSPFYLAIPADVAEISGDASGLLRLGRYMPHGTVGELSDEVGGFTLVWSAARGRVRLRLRLVDASSIAARNAAAAVNGWTGGEERGHVVGTAPHPRETCLPAMVVVHRSDHFDSLQPPPECVLVLEREDVEP